MSIACHDLYKTIRFNQDNTLIACASTRGFEIYHVSSVPVGEPSSQFDFKSPNTHNGSEQGQYAIRLISVLERTNLMLLVLTSTPSHAYIWDDATRKHIAKLQFNGDIVGTVFTRQIIGIVLNKRYYLYRFKELQLIKRTETYDNPLGLAELTTNDEDSTFLLASLGDLIGHVHLLSFSLFNGISNYAVSFLAHESSIVALQFNKSKHNMLCTASARGTIVRVWQVNHLNSSGTVSSGGTRIKAALQYELRRGIEPTEITSLACQDNFIAVSSLRGTVHVFDISDDNKIHKNVSTVAHSAPDAKESTSRWHNLFTSMSQGVQTLWKMSTAQYSSFAKIPCSSGRCIVGFDSTKRNVLIIVGYDGLVLWVSCANGQSEIIYSTHLRPRPP